LENKIALRVDRLRELREQRGWSQRELARRCGFGEAQVRKYENSETDPSSTYLKLMAEQLDVSTDYLLGMSDDPRGQFGDGKINDDEQAMLNTFRRDGWPGILRLGAEQISK